MKKNLNFWQQFFFSEAINRQLTILIKLVNNLGSLKTEKIDFFKKIKKNSVDVFESLRQFSLKFNDPEAISKQLMVLIKC